MARAQVLVPPRTLVWVLLRLPARVWMMLRLPARVWMMLRLPARVWMMVSAGRPPRQPGSPERGS